MYRIIKSTSPQLIGFVTAAELRSGTEIVLTKDQLSKSFDIVRAKVKGSFYTLQNSNITIVLEEEENGENN
jgi:hypothetical protein